MLVTTDMLKNCKWKCLHTKITIKPTYIIITRYSRSSIYYMFNINYVALIIWTRRLSGAVPASAPS